MIELGLSVEEELQALAAETRAVAYRDRERVRVSEPVQYGNVSVACRVVLRMGRGGRHVLFTEWWVDGRRSGYNAMRGKLRSEGVL